MRAYHVIALIVSKALVFGPASAQTLFEWPDTAVDFSAYSTIEECRAAATRVELRVASQEAIATGIWRDTMPPDPDEGLRRLPAAVAEVARRCMAPFARADSVRIADYKILVPLYLAAGWDDKAEALVERRIAAIEPGTDDELAAVLDTVIGVLHGRKEYLVLEASSGAKDDLVQPPRLALIDSVVARHLPRVSDPVKRLRTYWKLVELGWDRDRERLHRIAEQMMEFADSLTESDRERFLAYLQDKYQLPEGNEVFENRVRGLLHIHYRLRRKEALDSLRKSTGAYVRFERETWRQATGWPPETYVFGEPLGERAPTLQGDFWLGCGDDCGPRPATGRVSLVVFLSPGDCPEADVVDSARGSKPMYGNCARYLVPLRRVAERFPAVEVTVVARTHGYFKYLKEHITPAVEAELTGKWLDSFGVRAALAVTETEYWRLPSPDGRRIEQESENHKNYGFGGSWKGAHHNGAFLIDQDGIIVRSTVLDRQWEAEFVELIEILLERRRART